MSANRQESFRGPPWVISLLIVTIVWCIALTKHIAWQTGRWATTSTGEVCITETDNKCFFDVIINHCQQLGTQPLNGVLWLSFGLSDSRLNGKSIWFYYFVRTRSTLITAVLIYACLACLQCHMSASPATTLWNEYGQHFSGHTFVVHIFFYILNIGIWLFSHHCNMHAHLFHNW